jgi:hypothetical protein
MKRSPLGGKISTFEKKEKQQNGAKRQKKANSRKNRMMAKEYLESQTVCTFQSGRIPTRTKDRRWL